MPESMITIPCLNDMDRLMYEFHQLNPIIRVLIDQHLAHCSECRAKQEGTSAGIASFLEASDPADPIDRAVGAAPGDPPRWDIFYAAVMIATEFKDEEKDQEQLLKIVRFRGKFNLADNGGITAASPEDTAKTLAMCMLLVAYDKKHMPDVAAAYGTVNHVEMRNEILRNIKAAEARSRIAAPETT